MIVTRFAPSPTGHLHLGHAFSALYAYESAHRADGAMILRIEDIDQGRCRPEYETAILEDLAWLGIGWREPVRRQSEHFDDYAAALDKLDARGLLYPCFCSRADIRREVADSPRAPHGPDGPLYPGTCRDLSTDKAARRRASGEQFALRLNVGKARGEIEPLSFHDAFRGLVRADPGKFGDIVLARKDTPTSYHLAVTVDDHLQGVTLVTRGEDLFEATHVHRLLQALLGYATPDYAHHRLLTSAEGKRLATRDGATSLRYLRKAGHSAEDVIAMLPPRTA